MKQAVVFQRIEGLAILAAAATFYLWLGYTWYWLLVFLLAADVSMLGYAAGKRAGAFVYNLGHSYILPVAILTAGALAGSNFLVAAALIWLAHIGLDRAVGYGLKETTGFKHTHLGPIGKK